MGVSYFLANFGLGELSPVTKNTPCPGSCVCGRQPVEEVYYYQRSNAEMVDNYLLLW